MSMEILICSNNHHFVNTEKCPFCGEKSVDKLKARKGDCIVCGQLCPVYAYGCNIPTESELLKKEFIIK